jgi:membrane protein
MAPRDILGMIKEAFKDWNEDNAPRLGAALSYYTIFSIAPLLLISIAVAALFFGQEAAQGRIVAQIQGLIGHDAAEAVQGMIENARKPGEGLMATVFGTVLLLFGAGGAFNELRAALDVIWEIPPRKGGGIKALMRERLASFGMVLVVGFLLLVSLVVSAGISLLEVKGTFPGSGVVLQIVNTLVSMAVITVLFALIFKYLPDAHPAVAWKDIWVGAFITSALFTLGKFAIGLYLGRSSVASAYGAAGSLVLLLVWVYYSAQILFFGAELTQVYARRHGSRLGLPEAEAAGAAAGETAPSAKDAGRVVPGKKDSRRPPAPASTEPARPAAAAAHIDPEMVRPPTSAVGRGLAFSLALLLLGFINKKKGWPS